MTIQDIINEVSSKLPAGYTVKIEISREGAGVSAVLRDNTEMFIINEQHDITLAVMDAVGVCEGAAQFEAERN